MSLLALTWNVGVQILHRFHFLRHPRARYLLRLLVKFVLAWSVTLQESIFDWNDVEDLFLLDIWVAVVVVEVAAMAAFLMIVVYLPEFLLVPRIVSSCQPFSCQLPSYRLFSYRLPSCQLLSCSLPSCQLPFYPPFGLSFSQPSCLSFSQLCVTMLWFVMSSLAREERQCCLV